MTTKIVKLEQGADTLDLNTGRYCVSDFELPTPNRADVTTPTQRGSRLMFREDRDVSWAFSITVSGNTVQEVERGMRDLQVFLNRAGDPQHPLYVAYGSYNDVSVEPIFGQFGALRRFRVVSATVHKFANYDVLHTGVRLPNVEVRLRINPYSEGVDQPMAVAAGHGITEAHIGGAHGAVLGTRISGGATNAFTNPAFTNATYDNGWTLSAGALKTKNTDIEYIFAGLASARVEALAADTFTQSITGGITAPVSFYVKKEGGGAITTADLGVYAGADKTSSTDIWAVGDGWYRVHWRGTISAGAQDTGVIFNATGIYYVDAFMLQGNGDYLGAFFYGDDPGCVWDGTRFASGGTRTVGILKYPFSILNRLNDYVIRVVYQEEPYSTTGINNYPLRYLFSDSDGKIQAYIVSTNELRFTVDGTNYDAASNVSGNVTPYVFHFKYSGGIMTTYVNGSATTGTAATAATSYPSFMHIGTDDSNANHAEGTFLGFATFPAMTAAEITADYNAIVQLTNDNQRVDPLPYFWTEDADGIIRDRNDSSGRNYGIVGGLMGDATEPEYKITSSVDLNVFDHLHIGTVPLDPGKYRNILFFNSSLTSELAYDDTATGTTDANWNNGGYNTSGSITSTGWNEVWQTTASADAYLAAAGKTWYACITGLAESSSGDNLKMRIYADWGDQKFYGDAIAVTSDSNFRNYVVGGIYVPWFDNILDTERFFQLGVEVTRASGGTAGALKTDAAFFLANMITLDTSSATDFGTSDGYFIRGRNAWAYDSGTSTTQTRALLPTLSRPITLEPDKLNVFQISMGKHENTTSGVTALLTVQSASVRPLWDL